MIIAGVLIGPHGFNLLARDSSIILSGTAGLLYVMFLAGLEIDMNDFRKNAGKSTVLGLYGFVIPMIIGTLAGTLILKFSLLTSVLLASMFASHTLITYPIVSKLNITKNRAVNISVGSTLITNILALLVLAIIVGMSTDGIGKKYWLQLLLSFIVFTLIVVFIFPKIARWFFKNYIDNVSQYIFVLFMVFLGAVFSQVAGIEPIIGAFMAGLSLNRLIPRTSPLMNRIDFVGNAIFIPFFLIGIGMLIDYRAFSSFDTIKVAVVMTVVATIGKFIAAWLTQKNFKFSKSERMLIFGLTNAQAAATLAAVLVGYNIIIGTNGDGEPIRLLDESILNGTIVMILVTCTIASFATQKSAQKIALSKQSDDSAGELTEKILIPVNNPNTIDELLNLSAIIKSRRNTAGLYTLNIINSDNTDLELEKEKKELLEKTKIFASAIDLEMQTILRYDLSTVQGIIHVIKEKYITDLILGLHVQQGISDTFLGKLTRELLTKTNITTYIYRPVQPIATIKRHIVVVPRNAEYEVGFSFWLSKIWNIGLNTGSKVVFYATEATTNLINAIYIKHPIDVEFKIFNDWDNLQALSEKIKTDDNITFVLSRAYHQSYHREMSKIPMYLDKHFQMKNFLLIYPIQFLSPYEDQVDLTNSSLLETIEKVEIIGKTIANIFRKK
jgi:Kef-type K+ transport system membrane component KefB